MPLLCEVVDKINALTQEYEGKVDDNNPGLLIQTVAKGMRLLFDTSFAYTTRLPPELVLVSMRNRFGQGLVASKVHSFIEHVASNGFNPDLINGKPTATEIPPPPRDKDLIQFNCELVSNSEGLLPSVGDKGKVASVACSHTNAALRAMKLSAKAQHPTLRGADGNLSSSRLLEMQPSMADVLQYGLEWKVIRWQVSEVSAGRNISIYIYIYIYTAHPT